MILIDKFYLIVNLSLSYTIVRFSRAKKRIFVRLFYLAFQSR